MHKLNIFVHFLGNTEYVQYVQLICDQSKELAYYWPAHDYNTFVIIL